MRRSPSILGLSIPLLCGIVLAGGCARRCGLGRHEEQRLKDSLQLAGSRRAWENERRPRMPEGVIDFTDSGRNTVPLRWGHASPVEPRPLPARNPTTTQSPRLIDRSTDLARAIRQASHQTPGDAASSNRDSRIVVNSGINGGNIRQAFAQLPFPDAQPPRKLPPAPGGESPQWKPLPGRDKMELSSDQKTQKIKMQVRGVPLNTVLTAIAEQRGLNIVVGSDVDATVTVNLNDVTLPEALDSLMAIAGCTWSKRGKIIFVSKVAANSTTAPDVQGREIRVIPLNYLSAADLEKTLKGLISPVGRVFFNAADPANSRRTQEQIVIEDLPAYVQRVCSYVAQVDQPPRQVLIEAHVLQVTLTDELRHGVNIQYLEEIAGRQLALATVGFADPLSSPATLFSIRGSDLDVLVEAIKRTTDAKTLASPKVMVVNGQKAKIQIGERLGYLVTTTTETSTLQNVQFLDVGVVMEVTPIITADGKVLMRVKPEISSGQINIDSGLPEEETTEVDTTVLLQSGRGIVIGGLIQEVDDDRQTKIPLLGDLWGLGRLFQRRFASKDRTEIIIALVPKVVPIGQHANAENEMQLHRATTRLFQNGLDRIYRPSEPNLPDAVRNPRRLRFDRLGRFFGNLRESHPLTPDFYFPAASKNDRVPQRPIRPSRRIIRPAGLPPVVIEDATPFEVSPHRTKGPVIVPDSKQHAPAFPPPPKG